MPSGSGSDSVEKTAVKNLYNPALQYVLVRCPFYLVLFENTFITRLLFCSNRVKILRETTRKPAKECGECLN